MTLSYGTKSSYVFLYLTPTESRNLTLASWSISRIWLTGGNLRSNHMHWKFLLMFLRSLPGSKLGFWAFPKIHSLIFPISAKNRAASLPSPFSSPSILVLSLFESSLIIMLFILQFALVLFCRKKMLFMLLNFDCSLLCNLGKDWVKIYQKHEDGVIGNLYSKPKCADYSPREHHLSLVIV